MIQINFLERHRQVDVNGSVFLFFLFLARVTARNFKVPSMTVPLNGIQSTCLLSLTEADIKQDLCKCVGREHELKILKNALGLTDRYRGSEGKKYNAKVGDVEETRTLEIKRQVSE